MAAKTWRVIKISSVQDEMEADLNFVVVAVFQQFDLRSYVVYRI
jgi:hypothetical protein